MSARFDMDSKGIDDLEKAMSDYGAGAGQVVASVLHGEGAELIKEEIMKMLPVSGRTWKGKKAAASSTQPFTQAAGSLSVTVLSKSAYGYLYFPDDGSNSHRHAGGQAFMMRGAEAATEQIVEKCIGRLMEAFE